MHFLTYVDYRAQVHEYWRLGRGLPLFIISKPAARDAMQLLPLLEWKKIKRQLTHKLKGWQNVPPPHGLRGLRDC